MRFSTSRKLLILPLIALLFGITACDSDDEEQTDSELFVGEWNVTEVFDGGTPVALTNFTSIVIEFADGDDASITASPADGSADQVFAGTYVVNEGAQMLTLTLSVQGFTIPVPAAYSFSGEDEVSMTIAASIATVLGPQLFGTQFTGDLRITVERL